MRRSLQTLETRFIRRWFREARTIATAVVGFVIAATGQAQSIDAGLARATVGQPLQLLLRVRAFDGGPNGLGRDCVRAEVRQGDDSAPHLPLTWTRTASAVDGSTWVTLSDPQPVREPLLHVRAALVCGAPYTREFTLLADAPGPTAPAARHAAPTPTPGARRVASPPTTHPKTASSPVHLDPPVAGPTASRAASAPLGRDLAVHPATLPVPAPSSASPLSDAFLQLWHQDMRALHDEQRQSRALLASLSARLERTEREASQLAVIAGAAVLGWIGLRVGGHLWRDGRRRRVAGAWQAMSRPRSLRRSAQTPDQEPLLPAMPLGTPITAYQAVEASTAETAAEAHPNAAAADTATTTSARSDMGDPLTAHWPSGGHSQAALDETPHAELLAQVDRMAAEGYLGASVAVLESALQGRVGKSPGILLRLLDHYGALQQPWNRDRVGAELTAIYNVELPSAPAGDSESQADEGPPLDAIEPTWSAIESHWSTPRASVTLADALVRPSAHAPLSLAAFRDALCLHALSAERESVSLDRFEFDPSSQADQSGGGGEHVDSEVSFDELTDPDAAPITALPELTWTLEPVSP